MKKTTPPQLVSPPNKATSIRKTRERLAKGEISASELLADHLKVIEAKNPVLNALPTLCLDRAKAEAKKIDSALAQSRRSANKAIGLGPLTGLPYCAKDVFDTEGIRTTYGSPIFANRIPKKDAEIVRRIRNAGAVMVGKSNTPEFAAGSQTFNTVFGATRNPYDTEKTCGGSSGGGAVALASGMTILADGSDLAASLRNPANFCGVAGLRPSSHLEPRLQSGLNTFSTLSMVGPMARSVEDLRELFLAIFDPQSCGQNLPLKDWVSIRAKEEKARAAEFKQRKKIRLAWAPDWGGLAVQKEVSETLSRARDRLEACAIQWVDGFPDLPDYHNAFLTLRGEYFVAEFGELYQHHKSMLKDTVIWNIEQGMSLGAGEIARAQKIRGATLARIEKFMAEHDVDGIVGPTNQVLPFALDIAYITEINGKKLETYIDWLASNFLFTVAGLPAISIPAGLALPPDGRAPLPVGMQIVGRWGKDMALMDTAQAIEDMLGDLAHTL